MEGIRKAVRFGGVMKNEDFNLSRMTVEDLFTAKQERRQRLSELPFEQKIEIVKRLQPLSTQVEFYGLVNDDTALFARPVALQHQSRGRNNSEMVNGQGSVG